MADYAIHLGEARDLEQFGLRPLTGEADAYMERILFDLNADGVDLLTSYLGGNVQFQEASNWNSVVYDTDAVASIMMPWRWLPDIARYALFHVRGACVVYQVEDTLAMIGVLDPSRKGTYANAAEAYGMTPHVNPAPGSTTGRNQHQMSGRVS